MLKYMLDSNVCIHAMRNLDSQIHAKLDKHQEQLCISSIVLHELLYGADKSDRPEHQRGRILALTSLLKVMDFDDEAASNSGNIHATLAKSGQLIGAYDMLIAGHARSLGLTVVTNNLKEFSRVDGLRCEDWLSEKDQ